MKKNKQMFNVAKFLMAAFAIFCVMSLCAMDQKMSTGSAVRYLVELPPMPRPFLRNLIIPRDNPSAYDITFHDSALPGQLADMHVDYSPPSKGYDELHVAAAAGEWPRVFDLVFRERRDPNTQDRYGRTLLHHAARRGCMELLDAFSGVIRIEGYDYPYGFPNLHVRDNDRYTPIMVAYAAGHRAFVDRLLEYGDCEGDRTLFLDEILEYLCSRRSVAVDHESKYERSISPSLQRSRSESRQQARPEIAVAIPREPVVLEDFDEIRCRQLKRMFLISFAVTGIIFAILKACGEF